MVFSDVAKYGAESLILNANIDDPNFIYDIVSVSIYVMTGIITSSPSRFEHILFNIDKMVNIMLPD